MQIQSVNNYGYSNTNFKSAIPTVFWEKAGDSVTLVNDLNLVQRLGKILSRRANGKGAGTKEAIEERKKVMGLLYRKDRDYHFSFEDSRIGKTLDLKESIAGCFYPRADKTGWHRGIFYPRAMFMTGPDKIAMSKEGKSIGIEIKKKSCEEKIEDAKVNYINRGNNLGSIPTKEEMHVIVEKTKNGGYQILKANMYPPNGPKSPYVIMGYYR